jgi:LacI family transcriptional regulator
MTSGKARIKDIADLAGVSIGTVDRVLHERGEVAEHTRQKVLDILRETNYSPNLTARALRTTRHYHLATLLPEPSHDALFWSKHKQGIDEAINELSPFPLTISQITFNISSESDFLGKTSRILSMRPDAVLMAPIFRSQSIDFCNRLRRENIPFVFIDEYVRKADYLAYIGEDAFRSGRVAGQLADMITTPCKDIVAINIAKDIENIHHLNNRTSGFMNYFNESGRNKGRKVTLNILTPDYQDIKSELAKLLIKCPDTGVLFVSSSKTYKIARFLETENLSGINLVGYDLLEENVRYLKSGTIKFLIGQRPEEQAYKGIRKLYEYLVFSKIPDKTEYLPIDIVTSENVEFFL